MLNEVYQNNNNVFVEFEFDKRQPEKNGKYLVKLKNKEKDLLYFRELNWKKNRFLQGKKELPSNLTVVTWLNDLN